jgi:uncharacterized membrane protein
VSDVPPPPPPPPPPGGFGTPAPSSSPDIGAAISYGWNKFTQNVGPLIAIIVIPIAILIVIELIGIFVIQGFFGFAVFFALALLISVVAYLGIFNAALMATRGEHIDIGKAFTTDRWGEWIGFAIVYGLMLAVGYAICGVGALVVIAFWGLAPFYFLDGGKGIGDSLSASLAATRQNSGLPLALAVLGLIGWAGGLVCIGGLITYPLAIIGAAYLYRNVTGQSVAP